MKKKLLALAVAAALPMAAQAATADVTIYGKIHASIDWIDEDATDDFWDVTSRASRIGFKGAEELGDGLKMIWKVESQVNIADGTGTWTGRNAYIGMAGGWGTFLYGRHDTPMKMSTGKLDIFVDTIADYNLSGAGLLDIRAADAIAYVSPSFSGLTLIGAVVPDADYGEAIPERGDLAGAVSLAAMYSNGGLFLSAAWEDLEDVAGGVDADHWRLGAGFDMGNFHIGGVYADQEDVTGFDFWTINGSWKFGNNALKAMWGRTDVDGGDEFDAWAIGLDHNFSKRSKMYVIYADGEANLQTTNAVGEQQGLSLGMVHKF